MALGYDRDYIVSGNARDAVTPNFTVKEFTTGTGIFVHRELAGALQELREGYGAAVTIQGLAPRGGRGVGKRGCFAFVRGNDLDALEAQARRLVAQTFLGAAERVGSDLYLELADPTKAPPLPADNALERAVRVTAAYETSGDPFQTAAGNFDGAGLSFGPLQVNFGTGTLPEVFARFKMVDEAALAACFPRADHWQEWQAILRAPVARQIAWANAISTGPRKAGVAEPWKSYLAAVGRSEPLRKEMLRYAYDVYGRKLIVALSWLKGLWPGAIDSFPCLNALYDLCVQQGSLDKAHDAIRARVAREKPTTQTALVHIAVEERGRTAAKPWRADCISRRLGILYRQPMKVTEAGQTSSRENLRMYLVRDVAVTGAEHYLT